MTNRDHFKEHISGLHRDEMMGNQKDCNHCDPWHEHHIDMRTNEEKENSHLKWRPVGGASDGWTDAWIASQKAKDDK